MTLITHIFLDIGGVLLTNNWGHHARTRVEKYLILDWTDIKERHRMADYEFTHPNFALFGLCNG